MDAQRGVRAYQANAGATIECALASTFPTVRAIVGDESFAALARAYWHAHPPAWGDLAVAGDALPAFIERSGQLAEVPYLADVARLDAAMDAAERAPDAQEQPDTLALLGTHDPSRLGIRLMPGTRVVSSPYPIVTVCEAHHAQDNGEGDDPFAEARDALILERGEHALVWRRGLHAHVQAVDGATAQWMHSLLHASSLAAALDRAETEFNFEHWLVAALKQGWIACIHVR
jgi:hypothetical protein